MKNIFYLSLVFLLFNCGPEDSSPVSVPMVLEDQSLEFYTSEFGVIDTFSYNETLVVEISGDSLTINAPDTSFRMLLDISTISDNVASPTRFNFPSGQSGPSGFSACTYHPCNYYNITFSQMDFSELGILEGEINAMHPTNIEETQIWGSFILQMD